MPRLFSFNLNKPVKKHFLYILFFCCFSTGACALSPTGEWVDVESSQISSILEQDVDSLEARKTNLPLTGGNFWHVMPFSTAIGQRYVIDFQSTSVIGHFTHYVVNTDKQVIAQYQGGIQSEVLNPYFLRHGRNLEVKPGNYFIYTHLESPFLLAQPKPKIYLRLAYIKSIKLGNATTLLGLGVFLAMGFYYLVLGITRHQPTDYLYSVFIISNFIYNATALNVFSDVFGLPMFYTIGFPIMVSNMAYIGFVMVLLGITKHRAPILHKTGMGAIAILGSFWLIAPFFPNYSLEFARYGVGIFGLFGITSGIVMVLRGFKTARYYLVANIAFIIPGLISIGLKSLPNSTMFIEHLGLFAVAMEVVLLSLVLSYQLSLLYREKSANLIATQEALAAADNAVKSKERFLANISHELRTPLNAIQGSVDLISSAPIQTDTKEHLNVIKHSSSFLLFLINDILDLAKLDAEMLEIEYRSFNLREMVSQICSIYGSSFTINSTSKFELFIDDNVPTFIVGDEKRIEQVIANLLSNAFKFTENGTVKFSVTVDEDRKFLRFSVKDSGIGIAPENIDSMFSAFTQADSSISRKYGGTGLGLRIASRIVDLMKGQISAESQPGEGSIFWFTVPLTIATEVDTTLKNNDSEESAITFTDVQVLVVDDNSVNLKVISALLHRLKATVFAFTEAAEAIAFTKTENIDVVIMDVQMPGIDGLTASQMLREAGFNKPIIAFTANASEADQRHCFEAGMNDILIKPIKLQDLSNSLRKWCHRDT